MCSWTNPSTGKLKTQRGVPSNEAIEEDDESEDQVVYRYDLPNELLGLYQQRHQVKAQGTSHGIISKEKKRLQESSTKVLVPQSAVEEAAWASLTQADKHGRISSQRLQEQEQNEISHEHPDSTKGVKEGSYGDAPRKISWAEALEQLINQEVQADETRSPLNLLAAQPVEVRADVDLVQTTVEAVKHGARTDGDSSKSHTQRLFETLGHSKGKLKHHTAERFRINNSKAPLPYLQEGAPVPLAQRLQELVREDSSHNPGPRQVGETTSSSSSLTIAEKLQSLIESSASPEGYHQQLEGTKVSRQSPSRPRKPVSTVQINRSAIQDDIVDCPDPDEDESGVQGSSRYIENPVQRSRSARNVQKNHVVYKGESLEDIDNDEDFFDKETSTAKSISRAPSIAPTSISERFRNALLSAPPDVASTDSCGLLGRLETLLSAQKSKHMHFTKSLQRKQQEENLSWCLEVVILGISDEAQLTTCRCEVLRSPEEWNHERSKNVSTENAQNASVIDVIFSKISSGVELHVGRVVRIHPPWQEVPRGRQKAKLIFCTFFCEVIR